MADVSLCNAADADLAVVKNLVPFYVYDMAEHTGWACTQDGRFDGCDGIESYWSEPGKHAFMFKAGDEWAGFGLVRANHEEPDIDCSIGEFFVLRKFRSQGHGGRLARELFDRFRGRWLVEQLADNRPAIAFWRKVIGRYADYIESSRRSPWGRMNSIRFRNDEAPDAAVDVIGHAV